MPRAKRRSRRKPDSTRRVWTAAELRLLRERYATTPTSAIARAIGSPIKRVYFKAHRIGLKKDPAFLAEHCRLKPGQRIGEATEFKPGQPPANKGTRRPGWHAGRMRETQFKPGQRGTKWVPVGSERVCDGFLQRKVSETGYPPRDWRPVHVLVWEAQHGPVPKGFVVCFVNRDRNDFRPENLELVHRRDLMARNSVHNLPAPLKEVVHLKAALSRQITMRSRFA